jgi:signal transduction histidine kinase
MTDMNPKALQSRISALEAENQELRHNSHAHAVLDPENLRHLLHELRQPLQAARLFQSLLVRKVTTTPESEYVERLGDALDAFEKQVTDLHNAVRKADET